MDKKNVVARIEQLRIEKGISVYQLKAFVFLCV